MTAAPVPTPVSPPSNGKTHVVAWFNAKNDDIRRASELYGAVVAQARTPSFYASCGIEDTPEGRYELIVLHLSLVLERLAGAGEAGTDLSRRVIETFVGDMDDSMREMGVGDLSVPKKVKRAAAGLYERAGAYRTALREAGPAGLALRFEEIMPGLAGRSLSSSALAYYVCRAVEQLAGQDTGALLAARVAFPAADFDHDSVAGEGRR